MPITSINAPRLPPFNIPSMFHWSVKYIFNGHIFFTSFEKYALSGDNFSKNSGIKNANAV